MWNRQLGIVMLVSLVWWMGCGGAYAAEYAITMDDPHVYHTPMLSPKQRNERILGHLRKHGKKAILFVCGHRIDHPKGQWLLRSWARTGHFLANHSYSHLYYHSPKISVRRYQQDALRNHRLLSGYPSFLRLFRFPFLKEGDSVEKRDRMRQWLRSMQYRNGHVTIDASDWYIDTRLRRRLRQQKRFDLDGYRAYYLRHMWERAQYYDTLAKRLLKRPVKHTLLVHHNLLNALFLGDLIQHFQSRGWRLIDANVAYQDSLFAMEPTQLPVGESLLWSLAKQRGYRNLRYPAESAKYEAPLMDRLGL